MRAGVVWICGAVVALALAGAAVAADSPVGGVDWGANATALRGQNGKTFTFKCPPNGSLGSVYGTGVYTDDSKVCSAAVHRGLITVAGGGTVVIKIAPGKPSYVGSTKNGVTTTAWNAYQGSYSFFVEPKATGPILDGGRTWAANAAKYATTVGGRYRYACPPNGKPGKVIGTKTYAVASSVCSAAVHVGEISASQGGNVIILIQAGKAAYAGTVKNGVTSQAGATAPASFVFVKA